MTEKTFDEQYMKTILEMIQYLKNSGLWAIGLTIHPASGEDWEFKLGKIIDRFSEEHPYCKKDCDICLYGKHSECLDPEKCHNTDEEMYWIDLD